tara:strand:- start:3478 stop:4398 length:921 start_codon:yes stop_codon:yes gene_type:complete
MFLIRHLTIVLLALGAASSFTSCQSLQSKKLEKDDKPEFASNEKWRENYTNAQEKQATKPGWNQAPSIPPANMKVAGTTYSSVKISQPYIAMTFDDGPHPSNTPRLLDMMKQRNIKATFYVVGPNARSYPSILKRMIAEGHEVANHTWTHADLTKLSQAGIRSEMERTRDAIVAATGVQPKSYRPPYGAVSSSLKSFMKSEYGYPTILWNVDPLDWKKPGVSVVADRLVAGARNGGILLAHDIHKSTIDAMPSTFDRLLAKGFKFVTVSQLIQLGNQGQTAQAAPQAKPIASPEDLTPVSAASATE